MRLPLDAATVWMAPWMPRLVTPQEMLEGGMPLGWVYAYVRAQNAVVGVGLLRRTLERRN